MPDAVTPFEVEISPVAVQDLRERLARTRWPENETVGDWSQGVPARHLRQLCAYWADGYEMERVADRLNLHPQFHTTIDGLPIHFLHIRSPHPDALPLIMTHGWPGSVVEFLDVIGPLTDPTVHGGDAEDAFHLVCPSLPGFGFSGKPADAGWGVDHIAAVWAQLMERLGYDRYVAQGGDWGAPVTLAIGDHAADELLGVHVNLALAAPEKIEELGELTADEHQDLDAFINFGEVGSGYAVQQSTRPQTLGYGLADSPAGQCAWILEKFMAWSDCGDSPEDSFTRDRLLDNVMVYWLTDTATSSARLYWESYKTSFFTFPEISTPAAYTVFPKEIVRLSERWARTRFADLRYYRRAERGGHFAAFEVPEIFVAEVRAGFRALGMRPFSGL
jgi:pimeloyl-ACP methyl ester carboxylesterase